MTIMVIAQNCVIIHLQNVAGKRRGHAMDVTPKRVLLFLMVFVAMAPAVVAQMASGFPPQPPNDISTRRSIPSPSWAPSATQRSCGWREVLLAAAVQGAIFGLVKATVDRAGATAYYQATGVWPGDD